MSETPGLPDLPQAGEVTLGPGDGEVSFEVANEFAVVEVRRVVRRNGVRLEIVAPRLGRRILLDAVVLEGLAGQTPDSLSAILVAGDPYSSGDPAGHGDAAADRDAAGDRDQT